LNLEAWRFLTDREDTRPTDDTCLIWSLANWKLGTFSVAARVSGRERK